MENRQFGIFHSANEAFILLSHLVVENCISKKTGQIERTCPVCITLTVLDSGKKCVVMVIQHTVVERFPI